MRKLVFVLGLLGCSSAPPPAPEVALRGPVSTRGEPGFTHCECDFTCAATGRGFVGLATTPTGACAKGMQLCSQSGCTSCRQDGGPFCE